MPRAATLIAVSLVTLACTGLVDGPPTAQAPAEVAPIAPVAPVAEAAPPASKLRDASALTPRCFGWPDQDWTRRNKAGKPSTFLDTGDAAVDFTLKDRAGAEHALRDLLQTAPVLLVQGSYTCPRYQENAPSLGATAQKYDGRLHTVLVYNIEAHPKTDPSPYSGETRAHEYSDRTQAADYASRVAYAGDLELPEEVLVLVDAIENPVWCTYGTCASCSWLIRQDGTIAAAHLWHDPPSMEGSIDALLGG